MTPVIVAIVGFVSAAVSSFLTFLFGRRKNRAETISVELQNAQEVIKIWRELSKEQDKRIEELEAQLEELRSLVDQLKDEYREKCDTCEYKLSFLKKTK